VCLYLLSVPSNFTNTKHHKRWWECCVFLSTQISTEEHPGLPLPFPLTTVASAWVLLNTVYRIYLMEVLLLSPPTPSRVMALLWDSWPCMTGLMALNSWP
jgi:hypothetical protein